MKEQTLDKETFLKLRELVYGKSGICLRDNKESLVLSRIGKRLRMLNINSPSEYMKYIENDETQEEIRLLVDAISTNVTSFFRENRHFDFMNEKIAEWSLEGQKKFRIWSAGCSSGEEPYTIGVSLREILGNKDNDIRILATDISTKILGKARQGEYVSEKLDSLSREIKQKYFDRVDFGEDIVYRIKSEIRNMVVVKWLNLKDMPFPMRGPFDIIFCRNVMIYFDTDFKSELIREYYRLLKPGGYLFIGQSENLTGINGDFCSAGPSIYMK